MSTEKKEVPGIENPPKLYSPPNYDDLKNPLFKAIFHAISTWDIGVPEWYNGHTGAQGEHAMYIIRTFFRELWDIIAKSKQGLTNADYLLINDYLYNTSKPGTIITFEIYRRGALAILEEAKNHLGIKTEQPSFPLWSDGPFKRPRIMTYEQLKEKKERLDQIISDWSSVGKTPIDYSKVNQPNEVVVDELATDDQEREPKKTFVEGDTVQLKSGGPSMTIETIHDEGFVCTWYNSYKGEYESLEFKKHMLKKSEEYA